MDTQNFVKKLPYSMQQGLKYIYGAIPLQIRYGKVFRNTYKFLQESQWWSKEQLEEYQLQQLKKLLEHAYENVPYYRRVFDERGLKPEAIQSKEDLLQLPILTKEIIRNNFHELLAKNIPRKELFPMKTSGSTVSPLTFFWQKNMTIPKEEAFIWTAWNMAGYQFNEKRLDLTWERSDNSLWQYNPLKLVMKVFSSTLSEDVLHSYVNLIRKFQPRVLRGIPSNLVVLADFINQHEISIPPSIKIVLCGSEMLYSWQRELIEKAFHCRLFSHYGQTEGIVLATECEVSSHYHIFPEYGITEVIGSDGLPVKDEGANGRIIGTGFNNYAMPFIRYDVGDIAVWSNKPCACGRKYPLLQAVEGRENEYLVSNNGDLIPMISIPYSSLMKNIKQFQFYQDTKGKVSLKLIPLPMFTQSDATRLLSSLKRELKDIEVKIEYTDSIPKTGRGKFKYIIQKLPIKFGTLSS